MRFLSYGESHGPQIGLVVEGFPAGVELSATMIDADLQRRQKGYGRGGRMTIEMDSVSIASGIRHGKSLGSPIAMYINNRDWPRWEQAMSIEATSQMEPVETEIMGDERLGKVKTHIYTPRPGHTDIAGAMKYGTMDLRNILERSSARETATRVAVGALARQLLKPFGIEVGSYVQRIAGVGVEDVQIPQGEARERIEASPLRCPDPVIEEQMIRAIDEARGRGDSVGGCFVVYVSGLPAGLGSHVHWDRRLDGLLAQAVMSIPAIKGVEFGIGFTAAELGGSIVHDPIVFREDTGYSRPTNHAGGLEGGITNGEPLWLRVAMKPIPTLYAPLDTVDLQTHEPVKANVERSDVCAVPAAAVVAEAMVAWVLANAMIEKFGGDTLEDMLTSYSCYRERLGEMFGCP